MKKIINLIIISVLSIVMLSGCSVLAKNNFAGSYVEEGTGYSMKKDVAFNMAVTNALMKISNEHSSSVKSAERQLYATTENSNGRSAETFNYESDGSVKSNATINEYKIISRRYIKYRRRWKSKVTVAVKFEDVN